MEFQPIVEPSQALLVHVAVKVQGHDRNAAMPELTQVFDAEHGGTVVIEAHERSRWLIPRRFNCHDWYSCPHCVTNGPAICGVVYNDTVCAMTDQPADVVRLAFRV